ncbi:MAG: glycosyltransferase family 4 protein [Lachnospiraceae bacterium]|nr:glycosyltransferase family 4 protein [Lachnospiraceae bacterium]
MKILFHLNSMGRGGAERVVSILSQYFVRRGYEVIVATQWFSENEYRLDEGVKRVSVGLTKQDEEKSRLSKAWIRLTRLRQCIRQEKPDLVISFCCKANFRSAFSLLGSKIPLLVSVRNNPVEDYEPHKFATRLMEQKAAGCVFQTPDAMKYFSKKLQDKSTIIFNPIADAYLEVNAEKVEEREKTIISVGRIAKQKNQMLLVEAFAAICGKHSDYVLKIYGDVQDEDIAQSLGKYVDEHNLKHRVQFMGTTNSIKQEMEKASLFVLSSDFEGMPNALIEAMAVGLPVISTDCPCGGSALLIEDKVSGLLVPVGDVEALSMAMNDMLSKPQEAQAMGQEARRVLDKVHPVKICEEWVDYIDKILGRRK